MFTIHTHTHTQTDTDTDTHRHTDTQTHRHTDTHKHTHTRARALSTARTGRARIRQACGPAAGVPGQDAHTAGASPANAGAEPQTRRPSPSARRRPGARRMRRGRPSRRTRCGALRCAGGRNRAGERSGAAQHRRAMDGWEHSLSDRRVDGARSRWAAEPSTWFRCGAGSAAPDRALVNRTDHRSILSRLQPSWHGVAQAAPYRMAHSSALSPA